MAKEMETAPTFCTESPCLMFSCFKRDDDFASWKLFHSLHNDSYYVDFPELLGAQIRYAKEGWLLMSQGKNTYFFFNPSTKVKIELPPTRSFIHVCFTAAPTSGGDCIIFGIHESMSYCNVFGIIKFGEYEWLAYECSNEHANRATNCSPVYSNGLFYCLDQSGNLGVFNPNPLNEASRWVQYNKCYVERELNSKVLHQCYMAEVDGEIWSVFVTDHDGKVGVFKFDFEKFVWCPMQNLRNKCLYVSPRVSFAEKSDDKSLANKVYFNKFYGENGVVYSLARRMYLSIDGGFVSTKTYQLREMKHGTWFKHARAQHECQHCRIKPSVA